MGTNQITAERYNKIKSELKSPADDQKVADKFGIGISTARRIRTSKDFVTYKQRISKKKATKAPSKTDPKIELYKLNYETLEDDVLRDGTITKVIIGIGAVLYAILKLIVLIIIAGKIH